MLAREAAVRIIVLLKNDAGVPRLAPLAAVVPAILDDALLGQAVGGAVTDVLFGARSTRPAGQVGRTVQVPVVGRHSPDSGWPITYGSIAVPVGEAVGWAAVCTG